MKRSTRADGGGEFLTLDMARCLVLLSQSAHGGEANKKPKLETAADNSTRKEDVFECKTCSRRFSSFQALGGHRASHRLMPKPSTKPTETAKADRASGTTGKPRMHECSICGLGFSMGQALGGHMRKHRTDLMNGGIMAGTTLFPADPSPIIPVMKRTNSSKRITGLDLNLTPLENDLKLLFGYVTPNIQIQKPFV